MKKNQIVNMMIAGIFLIISMLTPSSARTYSDQKYDINVSSYAEEAFKIDIVNHALANQKTAYSPDNIMITTTSPDKSIQPAPESLETVKESSEGLKKSDIIEVPKEIIQESAPQTPEEAESAKETILASIEEPAEPSEPIIISTEPEPVEPTSYELAEDSVEPLVSDELEPPATNIPPEPEPIEVVEVEIEVNEFDCMDEEAFSDPNNEDNDHGDCPKCGRHLWTNWDQTGCFTFLSDTTCDCGIFVEAGECHHH